MSNFKSINISDALVPIVAVALSVPNLIIGLHSHISLIEWLALMCIPLGTYMLVMSLIRSSYIMAFGLFPLMILSAFQIVVVSLFDTPSPIGIDMFLNVVTSNGHEIGEMLSGLILELMFVSVLYVSVLVLAYLAARCKKPISRTPHFRIAGMIILLTGFVGLWNCHNKGFTFRNNIFPVNAIVNLYESVVRFNNIQAYPETSKKFSYGAELKNDTVKEVYLAIIGESARADNWAVCGYGRNTNPTLSKMVDSVYVFDKVFSESNTTHKAVPMLLSTTSACSFEDSIYNHKSIITAFNEAGFHTVFISNHERNGSFIEYYEGQADEFIAINSKNDRDAIPVVESVLSENKHNKLLMIIHLYGSHYKYSDRFAPEHAVFVPYATNDNSNRQTLINAYDNTVINTDYTLSHLIKCLSKLHIKAGLIYCSDHGEDLYDDERGRFLHASPTATYWQLHVPMLIYANNIYRSDHPDKIRNLLNCEHKIMSSSVCYAHSLIDMAGISTPYLNPCHSLFDDNFMQPHNLLFLNDQNHAVSLMDAGFDAYDRKRFVEALHGDIQYNHSNSDTYEYN